MATIERSFGPVTLEGIAEDAIVSETPTRTKPTIVIIKPRLFILKIIK